MSGLSCAYFLLREAKTRGVRVEPTIFEARSDLGGVVKTVRHGGLVLDMGPECFVSTKPAVGEIARELHFDSRIITQAERRTFIAEASALREVPEGLLSMNPNIPALLMSRLFSSRAKVRLAAEPLIRRGNNSGDESVADFVSRRFGIEFLERLAEPLIGGLYGADPSMLSAKASMPHLVGLEIAHGSVFVGMAKDRCRQLIEHDRQRTLAKSNAGTMSTFDGGMGVLVDELKASLGTRVRIINSQVVFLCRYGGANKWLIGSRDRKKEWFDAIMIALPGPAAAPLLFSVDESLSCALSSIKYSSPAVVSMVFEQAALAEPLKGSGFLVPKSIRRSVRACTFSSNKFRREQTREHVVLRASCNVADAKSSDEEIKLAAVDELRDYLKILEEPIFSIVARHENAIPQFAPGYENLLALIERRKAALPGFALVGNAFGGMGVSDCVMRARLESERLLETIEFEFASKRCVDENYN